MKKIIAMLCLSALVLASCQKDDAPGPSTAEKLLGTWKLQKATDEHYHPINTLESTDEVIGTVGDSVVFKSNGDLYTYSPTEGNDKTTWELLNETTIKIEDEVYEIKDLTTTTLFLFMDETRPALNDRYVQRIYFVRY